MELFDTLCLELVDKKCIGILMGKQVDETTVENQVSV